MYGRLKHWAAPALTIAAAGALWLAATGEAVAENSDAAIKALSALPGLKGMKFAHVTKVTGARNAYRAQLGSTGASVSLVGSPAANGRLVWSAVIVTADLALAKHLPPSAQILGDLAIERAIVAIAGAGHDVRLDDLPPELRQAILGLPGLSGGKTVRLEAGVNLLASLQLARSGVLGELTQRLGIAGKTAMLQGSVGAELIRSLVNRQAPKASDALGAIDLRLALGRIAPPGLAGIVHADGVQVSFKSAVKEVVAAGSATFRVTLPGGKPAVIATTLSMDRAPANGKSYFHFNGALPPAALAAVPHAEMLKLHSLSFDVALMRDGLKRVPYFGVSGKGKIGRADVKIVGTLSRGDAGKPEIALWADGEVKLADLLQGRAVPGLDHIALTHVSFGHGEFAGRARLGKREVAILAYLPAGRRQHNIVVGTGGIGLHDFVPAARNTPLDALALSSGAFFIVPKENAVRLVSAATLPALAVELIGGAQSVSADKPLDLRAGVNLFATLNVASSPGVKSLLEAMGGGGGGTLPLRGTLDPAMFTHTPWRHQGNGAVAPSGGASASMRTFLSHLDLSVPLPPLTPPGVGQFMSLKTGMLAIHGKNDRVAIGITTAMELKLGARPLVVEGEFHRDPVKGGGALLKFVAKEKTKLEQPFGIQWLSLDEVEVDATIDRNRRKVDLELQAKAVVGRKRYALKTSFIEAGGKIEDVVFALSGRVPLTVIPGLGSLPALKGVELVDPEIARTHISGEIDLLKTKFKVALLNRAGHWDLLFQHTGFKLAELLPALRRSALGNVAFPKAVLVLSQSGFTRPVHDFPAVIQPVLAELGATGDGTIRAEPGLSLVAAIDPAKMTGAFGKILHKLGVHRPVVVSGGVGGVLGGAPSLNLQANLPSVPAFPVKAMRARPGKAQATLRLALVGEELTIGVGSAMGFKVGRDELIFDASVNASVSADNVVLDVLGRLEGDWHNPAGIKGLTLEDVSITLGVNETGAIVVSLGGKTRVGSNEVLLAGGASLLPEALGAPEAIAFVGQVKQLRFGDLVAMGAKFVQAGGARLPPGDLPHHAVELHDITAALMTPGAYLDPKLVKAAKLEITGIGMALAGSLVIDGRRLGTVRGSAGDQGVKLFGDLAPFQVGGVAVEKATLDAALALGGVPHFNLTTRARPFGAAVNLDVGLDSKGFHFTVEDKVGSHYAASISARTTKGFSLSRDNDFALHATLGPDFIGYFRERVKSEVQALFASEDKALAEAERRLEVARRAVQKAEADHVATVRGAQRAAVHTVDQAQSSVADAEQRVRRLHKEVADKYAAAKQARQHLNLVAATALLADATRLRVELGGANAALGVAHEVLKALRAGAPLPATANPRVLAAFVALEAARAAVVVSEAAVHASRAVGADLRKAAARIGEPGVLDIKRALIDGSIATGASVVLDARLFGQRDVTVQAGYKPGDAKAIIASLGRAAGQFASHLRAHKQNEHAPEPPPSPALGPARPTPAPKVQMVSFDGGRYEIPAAQCRTECRKPPVNCFALLGKDWEKQKRPAGAGACPKPPEGGCEQVVIGARADTDGYRGCPGYRVFDTQDATPEQAAEFAACAVVGRVTASCARPIVIGSGWSRISASSGTAHALCQMKSCGWTVDIHERELGTATPTDKILSFDGNKFRIPESACVAKCPVPPSPPSSCAGPWSNQKPEIGGPRLDAKGDKLDPCPAPPREANGAECTQVVLGRLDDVARYKGCKGFIVLNRSDWTMERNDEFIGCAVRGQLGATCRTPIHIASGWRDTGGKTVHRGIGPSSITAREVCQLRTCGWNVELRESAAGTASPPGR